MVYFMKLNNEAFQNIKNGRKTIELRLFDHKRRKLDIGDKIIFTNLSDDSEEIAVIVKALYRYGTFKELFEEISLERCGFHNEENIEKAISDMHRYYSEEQISFFGVLGIKIELTSLEEALKEHHEFYEAQFDRFFPDGMK